MIRLAVRAAVAVAALGLLGDGARSYLVRRSSNGVEYTWDLGTSAPNKVGGKITYYIDQGSVSGGTGITGGQFATAVRAALQAWEDVDAATVAFQEDGTRSASAKNTGDKINRFGFSSGVLPPLAFASAYTFSSNNKIVDVDVVFNPDLTWTVTTPPSATAADTQGVATHEWGHGLGLDHIPLSRSTMYYAASYGAQSLRTPDPDDVAAAGHAYPSTALADDYGTLRGTVDVTGRSDDRGVVVSVIDFVTGFPSVSTVTEPDGSWEMEGVPPGVYHLAASPLVTQRLAGGTYSGYWATASTTFFPRVRGQDGASDGSTGVIAVTAGETIEDLDLAVSTSDPTAEPNDAQGQAHPITVGQSIAGRVVSASDDDWFSFSGTTGQVVSVYLHAQQLGSELDGRLYLRRPNGSIAAEQRDIAGTLADYIGPEGHDLDARLLDVTLDADGTWAVQVEAETPPDPSFPEDGFYVLTLLAGGGTPNALTSTLVASPNVVAANGVATSTLTFTPRSLTGSLSGAGLDVTMSVAADGDADGLLSPVVDHLDGTYTATLTAPASPGSDLVRASVDGTIYAAATVNFRGPAVIAASDFGVDPRRIRPDDGSEATVVLVPRDVNGIAFGPGHAVSLSLQDDPGASLGPTSDAGDGSYEAILTSSLAREVVRVEATVDGSDLGGSVPAEIGFPLDDVVDDARDDLAAYLGGDPAPPPAKAIAKLQSAKALLDGVAALSFPEATATAAKSVGKAVKSLEAAGKKGATVAALARELAEAARQSAGDAIAAAGPFADESKEIAALGKAQGLFDAGEALLDAGSASKAIAKYAAALKQTGLVHP